MTKYTEINCSNMQMDRQKIVFRILEDFFFFEKPNTIKNNLQLIYFIRLYGKCNKSKCYLEVLFVNSTLKFTNFHIHKNTENRSSEIENFIFEKFISIFILFNFIMIFKCFTSSAFCITYIFIMRVYFVYNCKIYYIWLTYMASMGY